mmetsp:Transcript_14088/g.23015  ORF Transcript_14088/g.23015 Transcript_14088/m.23015 type:complete len:89 (-) Transcript_14088:1921-2187(-)
MIICALSHPRIKLVHTAMSNRLDHHKFQKTKLQYMIKGEQERLEYFEKRSLIPLFRDKNEVFVFHCFKNGTFCVGAHKVSGNFELFQR